MLVFPHTRYSRLHVYYFDRAELPPAADADLIGTWIEDGCAILFFHQPKDELVRRLCAESGAAIVYQAELEYHDWEAGVRIGPFSTKHLHVRPVWETESAADGRAAILLDPSVVFGSGFHPTTRLCLEMLESLLLESGLRIRSALDLGTGTGLLAIAAAKLGVERVTALDCNPLAVQVARRNAELNGCGGAVQVRQFDLTAGLPEMEYDLVISNLYKGLLLQLFSSGEFWRQGLRIVSGFLPGMEPDLLTALPARRIKMLNRSAAEQWRCWLLRCEA